MLVSNTSLSSGGAGSNAFGAQSFETGDNTAGYTISDIGIKTTAAQSSATTVVTVREDNGSGEPNMSASGLVVTLNNPSSITNAADLQTFTVPAGTTVELEDETTYWVTVNEGVTAGRMTFQSIGSNTDTGASGWSIGNSRLWRVDEASSWASSTNSLILAINGTAKTSTNTAATGAPSITGTPQVGQTLTAGAGDMADADGLPSTAFPTGYDFQWVRVDSADVETEISGAESQTYDPATADVGSTLKVKVSFEDGGGTEETLTSDATAAVTDSTAPAPTPGALVSNLGQASSVFTFAGGFDLAQPFTTGSAATLSGVDIVSTDAGGDSFSAKLCTTNSSGDPTNSCTSLTAPGSFAAGTLRFDAPADTVLAADTTYAVVVDPVGLVNFGGTLANDEDPGKADGWSIADAYRTRQGGGWQVHTTLGGRSLRIAIHGVVAGTTAADLPPAGAFTVTVDGTDVAVTGVETDSADTLDLTLSRPIEAGETVMVTYTKPGSGKIIADAEGNETDTFEDEPVTNNSTVAGSAPDLTGATVYGTTLVLTYDEDLDTNSTPDAAAYSVTVDGGTGPTVSGVTVSGKTVTLTLDSAVIPGQTVTVSYDPAKATDPVQDESGLDAPELIEEVTRVLLVPLAKLRVQDRNVPENRGWLNVLVELRDFDDEPVFIDGGVRLRMRTVGGTDGGTATEGVDYYPADHDIHIPPGETEWEVDLVTLIQDTDADAGETVVVELSDAWVLNSWGQQVQRVKFELLDTSGTFKEMGNSVEMTGTIGAPQAADTSTYGSISLARQTGADEPGIGAFKVTRSGANVDERVCYIFETLDTGSATAGDDFHAKTHQMWMLPGRTTMTVFAQAKRDLVPDANEAGETVDVRISDARYCHEPNKTLAIGTATGSWTIVEPEAPTARFHGPPRHDGRRRFAVRLTLSDPVVNTPDEMRKRVVRVEGGQVDAVEPVDGQLDSWEVTVDPDGGGAGRGGGAHRRVHECAGVA